MPLPRLDDLETAVLDQIRAAQQASMSTMAKKGSARDLAEAYGSLGRLYHAYEFFDSAEPAYINASRLAPTDGRWFHLLGYLYEQTGRLEDAASTFEAALRVEPTDRTVTVHLGDVYLGLNRLREAREQFQSVQEVFPAVSRRGLGEVALRDGRYSEAVGHFRAVLDRVPQATTVHYSLAMAYRGLGRLDEARSHLERRGSNGIRAADPVVDSLQTLVRGERALVMQGRRAYDAGQFQDAANAFKKALAAAPASVTARINLGSTLSQLGDSAGAVEQFKAALDLESDNVAARKGLGLLLAGQRSDADAVPHLRVAFTREPDDADVSAELIGALVRLGRADDTIDVLTNASPYRPDDEAAGLGVSIVLADRGRYREAIDLLEDAHRRFPERAPTATTLARLLASSPDVSLRDGTRALDLATQVYKAKPLPVYGETIALALAELGRCEEAADWMRRAVTEAERVKDTQEAARLKGEAPKYASASCRPPGR